MNPYDEKEDARQEEFIFLAVLKPYKPQVAETLKAYKLIIEILSEFNATYPKVNIKLNQYYLNLFKLIEANVKAIETEINNKYTNDLDSFPDFYIQTNVFKLFSKPLPNLYEHVDGKSVDWEEIEIRSSAFYAQIEELSKKLDIKDPMDLPHAELLDEATKYLAGLIIIKFSGLEINLRKGSLKYNNNDPIKITLDNKEIKFLLLLIKACPEIIENKTIARELSLNFYVPGETTNKDAGEPIGQLRKKLSKLLMDAGMPKADFNSLIYNQKNIGYRITDLHH